ncbi:MAG: hypothetical protein ACKN9D_09195 [Actinomycetales bacterium]
MSEEALIQLWNAKRTQIIVSQIGPTAVLIAVFVLSAIMTSSPGWPTAAQYLTVGVAAATGLLAFTSQYAAIREGQAVAQDLGKLENGSALAKTIAASGPYLSLMRVLISVLSVVIFALVVWAILL